MDPEEKVLLERLVKLTEDNNKLLHRMRRAAHWGMFWSFIKFLLIVIPLIAAFAYLKPYLEQLKPLLQYPGL